MKLSVDQAITKAKSYKKRGEIVEAQRLLRAVLKSFPKNKRAQKELLILSKPKQTDIAGRVPQKEVNQLIVLYKDGRMPEVVKHAKVLVEKYPDQFMLWNLMGAAAARIGQLDRAVFAFKKAINIKPNSAEVYNNIGNVFFEQKKMDDALAAYSKATSIKSNYADAYCNIANVLKDQGELGEALEAYKKALSIKPDNAEVYNNMGTALRDQGKLEEAIEAFKKALSIKPEYLGAYYNMGNTHYDLGKLDEAVEAFTRALFINPDYAEAYNNMGMALKDLGQLEEAIQAFNNALSINPDFAKAYNNVGDTLQDQGRLGEAIETYQKALFIKPDSAEVYSNMGNALQDQGKLEEALEAYNKALAIKPDYAEAWANGAEILEKWNKLDDLEIWLDKAFNLFETVPADLLFMKSKLLWRYKKYEETSKLLEDIKFETISESSKQDYLHLKAKHFEKFKKFDEAFACFTQNNLLVKESKEYLKQNPEQYFQNLRDSLDKLKSSSRINSKTNSIEKPEFSPTFLVGFPRSGTTLLDTILRSNSMIEVVEEKGMVSTAESFLKKNGHNVLAGELITSQLNLDAQKIYWSEFNKHIDTTSLDKVYIDKLPLNLLQTPLIHQIYPAAKFILALRHPMDTILSCWMQNFKLNAAMANMVDLDRIVDFYCIAMETFKLCRTNYNLNVHEVRYEDLTNNFQKESKAVVQFLHLQWEPEMEHYQETALKRGRINTPSYSQVVQPIYQDAQYRWLNYRKFLEKYLDQVKPWISEFGYSS
tara:strand:- start:171 stop:2465 length:2295 start_codon:yes stop_codon:yes gene_type:complete